MWSVSEAYLEGKSKVNGKLKSTLINKTFSIIYPESICFLTRLIK